MSRQDTPFRDVFHALKYYLCNSPVRAKAISLRNDDEERGDDFDPYGNITKWSVLSSALWHVLDKVKTMRCGRIFIAYDLASPHTRRPAMDDIAKFYRVSRRTAYEDRRFVLDMVDREFRDRRLVRDEGEEGSKEH